MFSRTLSGLAAFALFSAFSLPAAAELCDPNTSATPCLNKNCTEKQIGTSLLDVKRENIIACLAVEGAEPKWKGTYGDGGDASYPKGHGWITATAGAYCLAYTDADGKPYLIGHSLGPISTIQMLIANKHLIPKQIEHYMVQMIAPAKAGGTKNIDGFTLCSTTPKGLYAVYFSPSSNVTSGQTFTPW